MSERPLKALRKSAGFQAENSLRVVISNGYYQRMSVSVVAPPRNQVQKNSSNLNILLGFVFVLESIPITSMT
jgi:hypothetical protein